MKVIEVLGLNTDGSVHGTILLRILLFQRRAGEYDLSIFVDPVQMVRL